MGEKMDAYRNLVGNAEEIISLGRIRRKGRIILKWIREIGWGGED
jgi:hypothetical protein